MLVVENKFVLLDFPRTGVFSTTRMLEKHFQTEWFKFFVPMHYVPYRYKDLPRVSFIRDPVTWYPSVFGYYMDRIKKSDNVYRHVLQSDLTIDSLVRLLLDPTEEQRVKALDWYTPDKAALSWRYSMDRVIMIPPEYWENHYTSLFQWKLNDLYGSRIDMTSVNIARFEDRALALPQIMTDLGLGKYEVMAAYVKTAKHENARQYHTTLDPSTIELIEDRDKDIRIEFEYT